jgi:hypothetical protein
MLKDTETADIMYQLARGSGGGSRLRLVRARCRARLSGWLWRGVGIRWAWGETCGREGLGSFPERGAANIRNDHSVHSRTNNCGFAEVKKGGTSLDGTAWNPVLVWHGTAPVPNRTCLPPLVPSWNRETTMETSFGLHRGGPRVLPVPRTASPAPDGTEPQLGDLGSQANGLGNPTLAVTERTSLSRVKVVVGRGPRGPFPGFRHERGQVPVDVSPSTGKSLAQKGSWVLSSSHGDLTRLARDGGRHVNLVLGCCSSILTAWSKGYQRRALGNDYLRHVCSRTWRAVLVLRKTL